MPSGLLITALLLGCREEAPVLTGIPAEPLLQGTASAEERRIQLAEDLPETSTTAYVKPDGVYIDVSHLTSRSFRDNRDLIGDQLGELISSRSLHDEVTEMTFAHAVVRLSEDRIFMMRVPLEEPMRRSDALQQLGFPLFADRYITFHREFRLNHEWNFRRIRLLRLEPGSELIDTVELWRYIPGEHTQRR